MVNMIQKKIENHLSDEELNVLYKNQEKRLQICFKI